MGFKLIPTLVAIAIGLMIWFEIPVPQGVAPQAWHLLALSVATIAAIIGKAMPIGTLSMLAIALVAITGVTSDKPATAIAVALSSLANPITSAMFIDATAPNPLVVKLIADATGAQVQLSWAGWALAMLCRGWWCWH